MREFLLILAGGISVFGLFIHMIRGRRLIVKPLLDAQIHAVPKATLEFSWNWGSVTMVVLSLGYLAPLWRADFLPLVMLATVYGYWLGALSFIAMRRGGFRVAQMPQWIAFWAASLCGLLAWGVL